MAEREPDVEIAKRMVKAVRARHNETVAPGVITIHMEMTTDEAVAHVAKAFAAIRADERERCARIVEDMSRTSCYGTDPRDGSATPLVASRHVASAIRQEPEHA